MTSSRFFLIYERSEMSGEPQRVLPVEGVLNPNNSIEEDMR